MSVAVKILGFCFFLFCFFQRNNFVPNRDNGQNEGEHKPHLEWNTSPNLQYITQGHSASACYRTFGIPRGVLGEQHER